MKAFRYPLAPDRSLAVIRVYEHGLVLLDVRGPDGSCISGPLAVREADLDTLRSALADVAGETGSEEATP